MVFNVQTSPTPITHQKHTNNTNNRTVYLEALLFLSDVFGGEGLDDLVELRAAGRAAGGYLLCPDEDAREAEDVALPENDAGEEKVCEKRAESEV